MSDDFEATSEISGRFRPFAEWLTALQFLTRLPIPFARTLDLPALAPAMRMFPAAGAVIGGLTGLVLILADMSGLPNLYAAAMAVAFSALVTGALHEDGLADLADGFGGGRSRDERLDIMRDSRIGTYGVIAVALVIIARISLMISFIEELPRLETIVVLACAAAFSRAMMVDLMWATRPARADGLSVMAGRPSRPVALFALITGGLFAGIGANWALSPESALFALIAAGVMLAGVRRLAMTKIGGQTGDVLGAAQVMTELAMLTVYSATIY